VMNTLEENGVQIIHDKNNKISLKYNDITDNLKGAIEKHFNLKLQSNEVITTTEWTGDIIKHLARGDMSLIHANDNIANGTAFTDSRYTNTIVFFKNYSDVGYVKTVLEVKRNRDNTGWLLLSHSYKVKANEIGKARYVEFNYLK